MIVPMANCRDGEADRLGQSRWPGALQENTLPRQTSTEAENLHRLQLSIEWLNRERMILAGKAPAHGDARRLPRAAQLGPIPSIAPQTEACKRGRAPFVLAPPLACERLPRPAPGGSSRSVASLLILTAVAIAGSIGYQVSMGSVSRAEITQAAPLQTPQLTGRQVLVRSSGIVQRRKRAEAGLLATN